MAFEDQLSVFILFPLQEDFAVSTFPLQEDFAVSTFPLQEDFAVSTLLCLFPPIYDVMSS